MDKQSQYSLLMERNIKYTANLHFLELTFTCVFQQPKPFSREVRERRREKALVRAKFHPCI